MLKIIHKYNLILVIIIFLAIFLRFWQIETVPPSMYWDEVSQGYNSYSLLQTGKDEHKEFLPLARFQAFGDYKAPIYIYLDVPFIQLLGKTTLAVRFPSALLGSATVLVTYLLVYELFYWHKQRKLIGLVSAFLLAISPWHIQLSRVAYEANIATFFTLFALYFFFLAKRINAWLYIPSSIFSIVAFYSFNAHRVFIPLMVIFLGVLFFNEIKKSKKQIIISCFIGVILLLPFLSYLQSPESKLRFKEVNIFSDLSVIEESNHLIEEDRNTPISTILHNRRVLFTLSYITHYFDFFDPQFLFFSGDVNPRFSLKDNGQLFLWELPFLLIGIYALFFYGKKTSWILLGWIILAPIAGATARETPHALRGETFLPAYQIIEAFGIVYSLTFFLVLKQYIKLLIGGILGIVVTVSFILFLHNYFIHYPKLFSYEWQYGYKQAVREAEKQSQHYDYIVMTESYGRPYIYVLFYTGITPSEFWEKGKVTRDIFGFYNVSQVGKYFFRKQIIQPEDATKKVLYVVREDEIPEGYKVNKKIHFLSGDVAFVLAER